MCKNKGCQGCESCVQCGSGAPLPATPATPNVYIDNTTGDVWYHDGTQWNLQTVNPNSLSCVLKNIENLNLQCPVMISFDNIIGDDEIPLSHPYSDIALDSSGNKVWLINANGRGHNPNSIPMTANLIDNGTAPATIKFSMPLGEPGRPCEVKGMYHVSKSIKDILGC